MVWASLWARALGINPYAQWRVSQALGHQRTVGKSGAGPFRMEVALRHRTGREGGAEMEGYSTDHGQVVLLRLQLL